MPTLTDDDAELLVRSLLNIGDRVGTARAHGLLRGDPTAAILATVDSALADVVNGWARVGVDVRPIVGQWLNERLEEGRRGGSSSATGLEAALERLDAMRAGLESASRPELEP